MTRLVTCGALVVVLACGGRGFRHVGSDTRPPAARVVVEGVYYWTDTVRVAVVLVH